MVWDQIPAAFPSPGLLPLAVYRGLRRHFPNSDVHTDHHGRHPVKRRFWLIRSEVGLMITHFQQAPWCAAQALLGAVGPGLWPFLGITSSLLDVQILRSSHSRSAESGAIMVGPSNVVVFFFL